MAQQQTILGLGTRRHPLLRAYFRSRAPVSVIIGPLGSGKTYITAQRILAQMCEQLPNAQGIRPTRWLAIRNTYPDLMATTARDFQSVFRGLGTMRTSGYEPPRFTADFTLPDGSRVVGEMDFLALDREDAVRKLRGTQISGVWLSEVKELHKAVVDMADLRHGRYPSLADGGVEPTWHGMLGDTNAPDTDHWLYRLAEEERPRGWEFFKQPGGVLRHGDRWVSNPAAENLEHLPTGYYERGMQGKSDDWIKVNLANEYGFVTSGRPVHPEYVDSVHGIAQEVETPPGTMLYGGVDFGRTPALVLLLPVPALERYVVLDELTSDDESAALFGPRAKRWFDGHYPGCRLRAWGDPAGDHQGQSVETTPIEILRAHGIPVQPAPSNDPLLRRAAVATTLTRLCMDGKPALLVHEKARMVRRGLQGGFCYRRLQVAGTERYTDVPDKNAYSHPVEALEYALLGAGEGRAALRPPRHHRERGALPSTAEMG